MIWDQRSEKVRRHLRQLGEVGVIFCVCDFMELWMRSLTFHASFFSIHKNDNNYTCHLCTSKERGRTNEMSVKSFELSRIKLLRLHKVQSSILHLYFSWHLHLSLKFFFTASATVAPNTPCPAAIVGAVLEASWSLVLLLFSPKPFSFPSWYLKRLFLSPVSCACQVILQAWRHGWMTWEPMWETSTQTFPSDTWILRL